MVSRARYGYLLNDVDVRRCIIMLPVAPRLLLTFIFVGSARSASISMYRLSSLLPWVRATYTICSWITSHF
ncbi:MAG: hypothetical protein QXT26_05790 [Thermoproteota archaeon]